MTAAAELGVMMQDDDEMERRVQAKPGQAGADTRPPATCQDPCALAVYVSVEGA